MHPNVLHRLLLLLFVLVPSLILWRSGWFLSLRENPAHALSDVVSGRLESTVKQGIPYRLRLEQFGLDLRLGAGQKEQNGIFITPKGLIRNIDQENPMLMRHNIRVISDFAQQLAAASNYKKNTYLAILPTSGGVLTQHLPRFAQSRMVDQRRLIEEIYSSTADPVRTVDVYSVLKNQGRQGQYIYFRTDNNLTSLGGYYTYTALAGPLKLGDRSLNQYSVSFADHSFYGSLYQAQQGGQPSGRPVSAPYRRVAPDTLALFQYGRTRREYTVTKRIDGKTRMYHTLYPMHRMELGPKLDVYLGGRSAITTITSSGPETGKLLVFGDHTAHTYLPFLANHYGEVTLVDLAYATDRDYALLSPEGDYAIPWEETYDNVLFVYGIETMIHTGHPARADHVPWQNP